MKTQFLLIIRTISLLWLIQLGLSSGLMAQQISALKEPDHVCRLVHDEETDHALVPPPESAFETVAAAAAAPNVSVSFSQDEGGKLLYHTVAGWNGSSSKKAQVSLRIWVKNLDAIPIIWEKTSFQYVQNGSTQTKTFDTGLIPIPVNESKSWQNSRKYHEEGQVIYLDSPLPSHLILKLYFVGFSTPVTITKSLGAYSKTFGMPFRAYDMAENEVWEGGSTHGGGTQVFGYDMTVYGYTGGFGGGWSKTYPGKDGSLNSHFRSWGKPIYAMADGIVLETNNTVPTNPVGDTANFSAYPPHGGAGNHFYIQHGENVALYAHLIKGSLNPALLDSGSVVKAGDFLGMSGNSGNSTGPHLHIHIQKSDKPESGPFRPLLFNTGWAIEKGSFGGLISLANWFELTAHGLPGKGGERAFVWPSGARPRYNDRTYTGIWRGNTDNHAMIDGATALTLQTLDNAYKAQGLRLYDMSVVNDNGNILYSGVWRAGLGVGVSKIQTGTSYAEFKAEYTILTNQGYRLNDIEIFRDAGNVLRYAGVYGAGNYDHKLEIGLYYTAFKDKYEAYGAQGYYLTDVEVYKLSNGSFNYAGVWKKLGTGENPFITANSWSNFTTQWSDLSEDGFRLVDLDTEKMSDGNIYYTGVFVKSTSSHYLWESNWNSFYAKWEDLAKKNLRLVDMNVRAKTSGLSPEIAGDRSDTPSESALSADVKIFPNPAYDQFTVQAETDILEWTLYNSLGQIVKSAQVDQPGVSTTIQVSEMENGTYYLATRTVNGVTALPVQVMH